MKARLRVLEKRPVTAHFQVLEPKKGCIRSSHEKSQRFGEGLLEPFPNNFLLEKLIGIA